MGKRILLFLIVSIFAYVGNCQETSTWKWQVSSERKGDGIFTLSFHAAVPGGWQLYTPGQDMNGISSAALEFTDSTISVQDSLSAAGETTVITSRIFEHQRFRIHEKSADWNMTIRIPGVVPAKLLGKLQFTYGKGDEFYPLESFPFEVSLEGGIASVNRIRIESLDISSPVNNCGISHIEKKGSLWNIFFLGFLGGLVALLTPCVFPMIQLTVSFFTKRTSEEKGLLNASLYGLFILMIYMAFSIPFHLIGRVSPTIYNDISTNIWLNIFFFAIFIIFAISFFGYFEITLPSGIANRTNAKQGTGIFGIFFMALTLAIVSFSCTGPILGTLLVGTASEGAWPLTAGLGGFGLALGLPFALFAMFPQWLHSLPKSGGWLNTIKVFLGFVELALALKFLSNADLVAHWGILPREIFFAIWILIFLALFVYLIGRVRFPHDPVKPAVSKIRWAISILVMLFTLYLLPGLSNTRRANLSLVSGFPPPVCYSVYKDPVNCEEPLKDYDEALKMARQTGKPILIDFTGWACVNCRKMEENVWPKANIRALMQKYVLVSLYVDDKKVLPITQQFIYHLADSTEKKIITVGDKWSTFQTENFNVASQPWYVAVSPGERLLSPPVGYTPDPKEFAAWLKCGLEGSNAETKR